MATKSRDIPIYDFSEALQREYVCAELRSKIYPHRSDKLYYRDRVMKGKKDKIDDIAARNGTMFPTMFNDLNIKDIIVRSIIPEWGYPDFIYKNEKHRAEFEEKDFNNYYMPNSDFLVRTDVNQTKVGVLVSVDQVHEIATIRLRGSFEEAKFSLKNISRIL